MSLPTTPCNATRTRRRKSGYSTLDFIPTLGTMLLGLIAGGWLREKHSSWWKIRRFMAAGAVCLSLADALTCRVVIVYETRRAVL